MLRGGCLYCCKAKPIRGIYSESQSLYFESCKSRKKTGKNSPLTVFISKKYFSIKNKEYRPKIYIFKVKTSFAHFFVLSTYFFPGLKNQLQRLHGPPMPLWASPAWCLFLHLHDDFPGVVNSLVPLTLSASAAAALAAFKDLLHFFFQRGGGGGSWPAAAADWQLLLAAAAVCKLFELFICPMAGRRSTNSGISSSNALSSFFNSAKVTFLNSHGSRSKWVFNSSMGGKSAKAR